MHSDVIPFSPAENKLCVCVCVQWLKMMQLMLVNTESVLQELLDPEKGYVKDDKVTLEVHVIADAPHGVW